MKTKLIMVEGIPGSGKSTFAQKIATYYKSKGMAVHVYNEGQAHPADLAWSACVPLGSLNNLLLKYSELEGEIRKNMCLDGDYAIIAYTQVKTETEAFTKNLKTMRYMFKTIVVENSDYHWKMYGICLKHGYSHYKRLNLKAGGKTV